MTDVRNIRVLTFNTWGLPLACKDMDLRLGKLAEYLRESGKELDVVFLQEVWTDELVALLTSAASEAGLVHSLAHDGGFFGAGLLLLSRFPLLDAAYHAFSVKGEPGALQGEALAGKGIGYARVRLPTGGHVHLFNTHTHANWVHSTVADEQYPEVRVPTDSFAPYRAAHAVDAVCFMRRTLEAAAAAEEPVIAGGDWNVPVDNLEMALLVEMLPGLADSWQAAGHGALDHAGDTCGDPANVYTGSIIGGYVPERIDYVWSNCRVEACERGLTVMPGSSLNYSDHFGVFATLALDVVKPALRSKPMIKAVAVGESDEGSQDERGEAGPRDDPAALRRSTPASTSTTTTTSQQQLRKATSRGGPVSESRVSPTPSTTSETAGTPVHVTPRDKAGSKSQQHEQQDKLARTSKRERLLTVTQGLLHTGLACTRTRMAGCKRTGIACAVLCVLCAVLQLYVIISSNGHVALRVCGAVAVVAPLLAGPVGLWMLVLWAMDRTQQRSYGQLLRTVDVWLAAERAEQAGGGR